MCNMATAASTLPAAATTSTAGAGGPAAPAQTETKVPETPKVATPELPKATTTPTQDALAGASSKDLGGAVAGAAQVPGNDAIIALLTQLIQLITELIAQLTQAPAQKGDPDQTDTGGAGGPGKDIIPPDPSQFPDQKGGPDQTDTGGAGGPGQVIEPPKPDQTPEQSPVQQGDPDQTGTGGADGPGQLETPKPEPTPEPTPEPKPEPTPEPKPDQVPDQLPTPEPKPTPAPEPVPVPDQVPDQTIPKGGPVDSSTVALTNNDNRRSATLTSSTGNSVELWGDPHVILKFGGKTETFDIGYGAGDIALSDGTHVKWDTFAKGTALEYRLSEFTVDSAGTANDKSVRTDDKVDTPSQLTTLTDAQLKEFADQLRLYAGPMSQPLALAVKPAA